MKKIIFIILFLPLAVAAQQVVNGDTIKNMEVTTDQESHYPDGDMALYQFIYQNIKWPDYTDQVFNSKLTISFDVLPDSSLCNFKILKSVDSRIDQAVIEIMKTIRFAPYIQLGNPAKSNQMINIPVRKRFE